MGKHTFGPWVISDNHWTSEADDTGPVIQDANYEWIADVADINDNANRIVACVNACEGINPDAVPELLAALEAHVDFFKKPHGPEMKMSVAQTAKFVGLNRFARKTISKAKKGGARAQPEIHR